jgi:hypothetical protein
MGVGMALTKKELKMLSGKFNKLPLYWDKKERSWAEFFGSYNDEVVEFVAYCDGYLAGKEKYGGLK